MGSKEDGRRERIGKGSYEVTRIEVYGPDTHGCLSLVLVHFSFMASCIIGYCFQLLFINERMEL